jgi:hypothetical protein
MEHEITGHSLKAYRIWKNPHMSIWKKVREIAIEILIIVFAVSLAAFLERRREVSNEQHQVKEFLLGLRTDLKSDIAEMQQDLKAYQKYNALFTYLEGVKGTDKPLLDSVHKYERGLWSFSEFIVNNGRYEGFKSSGKIIQIPNLELQNDILDLYQENIPILIASTGAYKDSKLLLFRYLNENIRRHADGSTNLLDVLGSDVVKNMSVILSSTEEIAERYNSVIDKSKKIMDEIGKEYPE